jgi:hypothetical protein
MTTSCAPPLPKGRNVDGVPTALACGTLLYGAQVPAQNQRCLASVLPPLARAGVPKRGSPGSRAPERYPLKLAH